MDLAATLRQARESRGLTCDELARRTRIPRSLLLVMERGDWAKLPGGIFTRGYLRAYAREVGLDGEALVAQFRAEHAPAPREEPAAEAAPTPPARGAAAGWPRWVPSDSVWRSLTWPAVGVALLLVFYLAPTGPSPSEQAAPVPAVPNAATGQTNSIGEQKPGAVGTAAPRSQHPVPAATDAVSRETPAAGDITLPLPAADVPITMDLAVTRPCWVAATVDGTRKIFRIVRPGEHEQAQGRVLAIRVGDAAALQLSLDGQLARPLGAAGQVLTIRITRDNYRSLLPPRPRG